MNEINFWEHTKGMSVQKLKTVGHELTWHGKNKSKFPNSGTLKLYIFFLHNTSVCPKDKQFSFIQNQISWNQISILPLTWRYRESGYFFPLPPPKKWKSKSPYFPNSPTFPIFFYAIENLRALKAETGYFLSSATTQKMKVKIPIFPKIPQIPQIPQHSPTFLIFFYVDALENLRALKAETGYLLSSTTTTQKNESQRHVGLLQQVTPRCVGAYFPIFPHISPNSPTFPIAFT